MLNKYPCLFIKSKQTYFSLKAGYYIVYRKGTLKMLNSLVELTTYIKDSHF